MARPAAGALVHLGYRTDIDGLRAVAILSVVCFHAFPAAMPGGFVGVDVFFVISGYLISGIILGSLARGTFSFADFYARRVLRIVPALVTVLVASYAIGWAMLFPDEFRALTKHLAAGAAFIANLALRKEGGYFDGAAETKPGLHLWSLGVEEQFYIVWPLVLWIGWRLRHDPRIGILVIGAASLAWNLYWVDAATPKAFFSPLVRFWELLAGAMLAQAAVSGTGGPARPAVREAMAVAGAALLLVSLVALDRSMPFPGWRAMLPVAGAVLLIAAGPGTLVNRFVLGNPVMVWVGLISYPLYLWHWPLLSFAGIATMQEPSVPLRLAAVALAVLLAWGTYAFIERPIRFGSWRRLRITTLSVALVLAGAGAWVTHLLDGLPGRFPAEVEGLASYRYDSVPFYRGGSCFLATMSEIGFPNCPAPQQSATAPLVMLWGDSHAAHLYPGLSRADRPLAQFTAAACPPLPGVDFSFRENCRAINDDVVARATALRPDIVILAANWRSYDWSGIDRTVRVLRDIGVKQIVLVGPVPQWRLPVAKALVRYALRGDGTYPDRMVYAMEPGLDELDQRLAETAARLGLAYASPYRALCDARGCRTFVGSAPAGLLAWDTGHLTAFGSDYLVGALGLP
ncbi:MAG: acyltransferase [Rhodoplanes sp.]|uniref:acyltransferase family protein n=1 Tax=Rhodoplanes sp. TaxID=1968906 RepID=UPI001819EB0B|nr:acyltransferase family protein [Rhodoplanes sp.]NVO17678.1 acyltransferase [Rhodoplanes sp.]